MQQMLSKGQVYAEELTGQLGERLPGAVALFAKGMNMTTSELLKAMQNGEVSAQAVINFARENAKAIDAQIATASKGVDAMEARAQNAMTMFKLALADSGFIDAYVNMLQRITEFLNSSDGKEAAKNLGEAFTKIAEAVIWCVDNVDLLIDALTIFAGLKVVQVIGGMIMGMKQLVPLFMQMGKIGDGILKFLSLFAARLTTGTGAAKLLGLALGGLVRVIPLVGWALLAYDIGAIMYDQSKTFAKAVDEVVRDFKNLGNQIIALAATPTAAIQDLTYAVLRPITTMFSDTLNKLARWIADVLRLIPGVGEDLAKWALNVADNLTKENRDMFQNVKGTWDEVNKSWNQMNDEIAKKYGDTMSNVVKQTLETKAKLLQADLAGALGFQFTADPGGGLTERQREIDALTKEFGKLQKSAEKADMAGKKALQRKSLSGRLALVDEEFAPQMKRAKALGGKEGDALVKQLNGIIALRKQAETAEFNASQRSSTGIDKRAKALENLTQKYKELNDSIQLKQVEQDPTSSLAERTTAAVNKANTQIDKYIAQAKKLGGAQGDQLAQNFTTLKAINQQYITEKMQLEEVERLQNKVNSLLAIRKARIDEINAKRQAGVINEDQQVAAVVQVNQETQSPIESALTQLEAAGTQAQALLGPEKWAELQANIAATKASLVDLTGTFTKMDTTIVQGVLDGMATALNSIVDELVQVGVGAESMGQAFQNAGVAVLAFFAKFLQQIAIAILQQMALNALASFGGGIGGAAVALGGVAAKHNGGIVGSSTTGGMQQRGMNPGWFANAPRFHDGGLPGLKSDEVPAILQKGEQVLDKNDPNNILNQNRSNAGSQGQPQAVRFVLVDDRTKVPEAMNTPEGEQAVLQILQRNSLTVRQMLRPKSNGRQ
jgi:tape measure domain-containing protein